jgi:hypothetical protein
MPTVRSSALGGRPPIGTTTLSDHLARAVGRIQRTIPALLVLLVLLAIAAGGVSLFQNRSAPG